MISYFLAALIAGVIIFELIEHILFPLAWSFAARRKRSPCGLDGLPGKLVEVKEWSGTEGWVLLEGELWNAVSSTHLRPGDKAVVQEVKGLTLEISKEKI